MIKKIIIALFVLVGFFMAAAAMAGSLDSPAAPTSPDSAMFTLEDIYNKLNTRTNVTKRTGAFTEPVGGPTNGTMHTLNDIMTLVTNRAPEAKTGQTTSYLTGDDGTYQKGVAWPSTRFTTNNIAVAGTNVVTDNSTGLMWVRNANLAGQTDWTNAVQYCATNLNVVNYCGYSDWRLPNLRELLSLMDFGHYNRPLPSGHPFNNVQAGIYWTSSTRADNTANAWRVSLNTGCPDYSSKVTASANYLWPVRGGGD